MFNSGVGFLEIVVIAGLALMLLGPDKFPGFAKMSVRTFRDIKKYMTEAQREIASELNPMKDELNKLKKIDVEGYVDKLINDDEKSDSDDQDDDDEIEGEYNGEPEPDMTQDWYPEEENHIMAGDDETADSDASNDSDEVDEWIDSPSQHHPDEVVPYDAAEATSDSESEEDAEISPETSDALVTDSSEYSDSTEDIDSREEVVDAENPERLET